MTRHGAHSYSYTGIAFLLSRDVAGGRLSPATRSSRQLHRHDPRRLCGRDAGHALEIPDAGGVQPEDLRLDLVGELRIPVTLDELIGDLELPERLDLPLRVTPQRRVGPPHHVVRPEVAQQRPEQVGALERPARHRRRERRADLGVEVLPLRLEPLQRGQLTVIRPGRVVGDEVEIGEVVADRVEILRMGVPRHELAARDALVTADVLEPERAGLLPDRLRYLPAVEPP